MHPAAAQAPQSHSSSYDFVKDSHDGRKYRMLNVIDEFRSHECLAIQVAAEAQRPSDVMIII